MLLGPFCSTNIYFDVAPVFCFSHVTRNILGQGNGGIPVSRSDRRTVQRCVGGRGGQARLPGKPRLARCSWLSFGPRAPDVSYDIIKSFLASSLLRGLVRHRAGASGSAVLPHVLLLVPLSGGGARLALCWDCVALGIEPGTTAVLSLSLPVFWCSLSRPCSVACLSQLPCCASVLKCYLSRFWAVSALRLVTPWRLGLKCNMIGWKF